MPGPGFEPGLLRPRRSVLTTRRSRLTIPPTAGWKQKTQSLTLIQAPRSLEFELEFPLRMQSKIMSLGHGSKTLKLQLQNIFRMAIFKNLCKLKIKEFLKSHAGTRIRNWVTAATTQCPNHQTIAAYHSTDGWLETENLVSYFNRCTQEFKVRAIISSQNAK